MPYLKFQRPVYILNISEGLKFYIDNKNAQYKINIIDDPSDDIFMHNTTFKKRI